MENYVLPASAVGIHPRVTAKKGCHAPLHRDTPSYWLVDSRNDAEQRALAGAVPSQQREPVAALEREIHAIQCLNDDVIGSVVPDAAPGAQGKDLFFQGTRTRVKDGEIHRHVGQ